MKTIYWVLIATAIVIIIVYVVISNHKSFTFASIGQVTQGGKMKNIGSARWAYGFGKHGTFTFEHGDTEAQAMPTDKNFSIAQNTSLGGNPITYLIMTRGNKSKTITYYFLTNTYKEGKWEAKATGIYSKQQPPKK